MLKIELWIKAAPLSRPEFLLQWSAMQIEKIGTKCILIKSAADLRATWEHKNLWEPKKKEGNRKLHSSDQFI